MSDFGVEDVFQYSTYNEGEKIEYDLPVDQECWCSQKIAWTKFGTTTSAYLGVSNNDATDRGRVYKI